MVEHVTFNHGVLGSIPSALTKLSNNLKNIVAHLGAESGARLAESIPGSTWSEALDLAIAAKGTK